MHAHGIEQASGNTAARARAGTRYELASRLLAGTCAVVKVVSDGKCGCISASRSAQPSTIPCSPPPRSSLRTRRAGPEPPAQAVNDHTAAAPISLTCMCPACGRPALPGHARLCAATYTAGAARRPAGAVVEALFGSYCHATRLEGQEDLGMDGIRWEGAVGAHATQ